MAEEQATMAKRALTLIEENTAMEKERRANRGEGNAIAKRQVDGSF